jgi:hypothetical protein
VTLRHDCAVRGFRGALALVICALALTSCSVLSGRSASEPTSAGTGTAGGSSAAAALHAGYTESRAVSDVLAAAKNDFETVYTFDYRHLAKYLTAGLHVTTSPYATTYRAVMQGQGAVNLRAAKLVQVATAKLAALARLSTDGTHATAIVYGTLTSSSAGSANATMRTITNVLRLERHGFVWRIAILSPGATAGGRIPANADLRSAISAARKTISGIYGLRRAHFNVDIEKALEASTGQLQATLLKQETSLRQALTDGHYDLSSKIVGFAVVKAAGDEAEFVMAINEYRLSRLGTKLGPYPHTVDVTATGVGGKWRMSSATPMI